MTFVMLVFEAVGEPDIDAVGEPMIAAVSVSTIKAVGESMHVSGPTATIA